MPTKTKNRLLRINFSEIGVRGRESYATELQIGMVTYRQKYSLIYTGINFPRLSLYEALRLCKTDRD